MSYKLSQYIGDARYLLRDDLAIWTSNAHLTRWINQARREAARRTGCIRLLLCGKSQYGASSQPGNFVPGAAIPGSLPGNAPGDTTNLFQTIPGVESYPFINFGNSFLRQQYQGADQIIDIIDNAVSWGNAAYRPVLNWCPWDEMQAYMRAWSVLNSAFPLWWSTQGDGASQSVYYWPPPVQYMEMEWDVTVVPKPLNTDDDYELLPDNFTTAIKFGAAALSYMNTRPATARIMHDSFLDMLGVGRDASDRGKTPSMYFMG